MPQTAPADDFPLERIQAVHRSTRRITLMLAGTFPLLALAVEAMRHGGATPVLSGTDTGRLRIICFAIAGVLIFAATVIKGFLLRRVPPTPEGRLTWLRAASLCAASIAEWPAILGFALFILTGSRSDFYILLIVAAYLLVRHLPQQAAWEVYVRRGGDAR
jgi:hypothetical protein